MNKFSHQTDSKINHNCDLGDLTRIRDEKLMDFVLTTILNPKHPTYKTIHLNYGKKVNILLPSLEMPALPSGYRREIDNYVRRKSEPRNSGWMLKAENHFTELIDGIPYNPNDFQFAVSNGSPEKRLLRNQIISEAMESIKLSFPNEKKRQTPVKNPTEKRKSRSVPLRVMPGKQMRDRLQMIASNSQYKSELQEEINTRMGSRHFQLPSRETFSERAAPKQPHSGFARTRGRRFVKTENSDLKTHMHQILLKSKEVEKFNNERIEKDWSAMVSLKSATHLASESKEYQDCVQKWTRNPLLSKSHSAHNYLSLPKRLSIPKEQIERLRNLQNEIITIKKGN